MSIPLFEKDKSISNPVTGALPEALNSETLNTVYESTDAQKTASSKIESLTPEPALDTKDLKEGCELIFSFKKSSNSKKEDSSHEHRMKILDKLFSKYKTRSLEQALRRVMASIIDTQGIQELKFLLEQNEVNINAAVEDSGKTALHFGIEYCLKLFDKSPLDKKALQYKLEALSYFLLQNPLDSKDAKGKTPLEYVTSEFQRRTSLLPKNSGTVSEETQHFTIMANIIFSMIATAQKNQALEKALLECRQKTSTFTHKPILICENHLDQGTSILCDAMIPALKNKGYKLIAIEEIQPLEERLQEIEHMLNSPKRDELTSDCIQVMQNTAQQLKLFKRENLTVIPIEPLHNKSHKIPIAVQQMSDDLYHMDDLMQPLRDKGLLLHFALLAARHQGKLIGIVGASHGCYISNEYKRWLGLDIDQGKNREILFVIPYKDPSLVGIGKYLLLNEAGELVTYFRELLAKGALELDFSSEGSKQAALKQFLEKLNICNLESDSPSPDRSAVTRSPAS